MGASVPSRTTLDSHRRTNMRHTKNYRSQPPETFKKFALSTQMCPSPVMLMIRLRHASIREIQSIMGPQYKHPRSRRRISEGMVIHFRMADGNVLPSWHGKLHFRVPSAVLVGSTFVGVVVGCMHVHAKRTQLCVKRDLVLPLPLHGICGIVVVMMLRSTRNATIGPVCFHHRESRSCQECQRFVEQLTIPPRGKACAAAGGSRVRIDRVISSASPGQCNQIVATNFDPVCVRVVNAGLDLSHVCWRRVFQVESRAKGKDEHVKAFQYRHLVDRLFDPFRRNVCEMHKQRTFACLRRQQPWDSPHGHAQPL
eukprot:m.257361 g.257361  ORF g.257361 m.257361 type:complete len:311 (+) comp19634_c0_seq1:974-1906(+)